MLEFGQPLHAYDLGALPSGPHGGAPRARGEQLEALDGGHLALDRRALVITAKDEAVGVAGVIGGPATRITDATTDILLESAAFDPRAVRRTRRSLNVSTDASYRFERGSDRDVCRRGIGPRVRADQAVAGGHRRQVRRRVSGAAPPRTVIGPPRDRAAPARRSALDRGHRGAARSRWSSRRMSERARRRHRVDSVVSLGHRRRDRPRGGSRARLRLREHRQGVALPRPRCRRSPTRSTGSSTASAGPPGRARSDRGSDSSFTDGREQAWFGWADADPRSQPIAVAIRCREPRPLRTHLLPAVLDVVAHNLAHGRRELHVFTVGRVFLRAAGTKGLPDEPTAPRHRAHAAGRGAFWRASPAPVDLFEIKSEVEMLLATHRPLALAEPGLRLRAHQRHLSLLGPPARRRRRRHRPGAGGSRPRPRTTALVRKRRSDRPLRAAIRPARFPSLLGVSRVAARPFAGRTRRVSAGDRSKNMWQRSEDGC